MWTNPPFQSMTYKLLERTQNIFTSMSIFFCTNKIKYLVILIKFCDLIFDYHFCQNWSFHKWYIVRQIGMLSWCYYCYIRLDYCLTGVTMVTDNCRTECPTWCSYSVAVKYIQSFNHRNVTSHFQKALLQNCLCGWSNPCTLRKKTYPDYVQIH